MCHYLQIITEPESNDEVVWRHEEDKKEDQYTSFSTGTDLATDCEPVKSETDWESQGETTEREPTEENENEADIVDENSQRDIR